MSALKKLFCEHPASVDETYFEHLMFACGFGLKMIIGGLACIVHGFLPFLFTRTGSRSVCDLHETLRTNGRPHNAPVDSESIASNLGEA